MVFEISAAQVLTAEGWLHNAKISIDGDGLIAGISECDGKFDHSVGILLPAMSNVHSHSFQRAMAGLAEARGPGKVDDFWTWRQVMYRFLEILTPDDIGIIAAQVQMEMLEAGYAAQAEFHYLHHAPGGEMYEQMDETSVRHFEAAKQTGIGYTHLPVLYMQGGLDGRPLRDGQLRFGCDLREFEKLFLGLRNKFGDLPADFRLGVAPHSLRAVSAEGLELAVRLCPDGPIHIHAAEQVGEVTEVLEALGQRPVQWLLENLPVDESWCLIHATQMTQEETLGLAASGAVAGLCPITEANLGDGIFNARQYLGAGGRFGIGSDSNVRIGLTEELRMLEVSQRLRDRQRAILTDDQVVSNGRYLYERAARGSARAIGRDSGRIEIGALADLVALDGEAPVVRALREDGVLDAWIFAGSDKLVSDVWAAGRHVVRDGRHIHHDEVVSAYAGLNARLRGRL